MTTLPLWIQPQLTRLVDAAPEGEGWLHEIKYDGYRMHARLDRGAVKLLTRTGLDWTSKYPAIARALAGLGGHPAYLTPGSPGSVQIGTCLIPVAITKLANYFG
jgi:ATP-dependent DNA ligase